MQETFVIPFTLHVFHFSILKRILERYGLSWFSIGILLVSYWGLTSGYLLHVLQTYYFYRRTCRCWVGVQGECPCRMSDRGPLRVGSSGSVSEFSFIAEEFWHLHWNTYSGYRFIPNLEKSLKIQPVIRM